MHRLFEPMYHLIYFRAELRRGIRLVELFERLSKEARRGG